MEYSSKRLLGSGLYVELMNWFQNESSSFCLEKADHARWFPSIKCKIAKHLYTES